MHELINHRVARGAAWLDETYPGWWKSIDLGIFDISDCYNCVLGQVYSGHIPADERGQLTAQLAQRFAAKSDLDSNIWRASMASWGGFSILEPFHELPEAGAEHGFLVPMTGSLDYVGDYRQILTDGWTQTIISRRMAELRALELVS